MKNTVGAAGGVGGATLSTLRNNGSALMIVRDTIV